MKQIYITRRSWRDEFVYQCKSINSGIFFNSYVLSPRYESRGRPTVQLSENTLRKSVLPFHKDYNKHALYYSHLCLRGSGLEYTYMT